MPRPTIRSGHAETVAVVTGPAAMIAVLVLHLVGSFRRATTNSNDKIAIFAWHAAAQTMFGSGCDGREGKVNACRLRAGTGEAGREWPVPEGPVGQSKGAANGGAQQGDRSRRAISRRRSRGAG